ncbi:WD40 repeat domain-containing protein [Streptomyces coeruleorubidus]|uniref:WD40 repeat domain-containing protein n=1 Tax=Streptomyces coeruleorubidus TaxID=116188 RepID=UPI0037A3098A
MRIWDAATGHPIGNPLFHTPSRAPFTGYSVNDPFFNPGSVNAVSMGCVAGRDIIVSGGTDGRVRIWYATTGQATKTIDGHQSTVYGVAVGRAAGRDLIVSGGNDRTVQTWDTAGQPIGSPIAHTGSVKAVAVGRVAGQDIIVSGTGDCNVRIWDAITRKRIGVLITCHTRGVNAVAVGRDIIASGGDDMTVQVWDAATGRPVGAPLIGHTRPVNAIAVGRAAGRDIIVSGSDDGTVRIWDAAGRLLEVLDQLLPVNAVALSSNGHLYVAAGLSICAYASPGSA